MGVLVLGQSSRTEESPWLHRATILILESSAGANIMPERFSETLRAASEPGWSQAVGHRFVKELFTGALPDAVMARYLIQDHRFLDSFLILLGAAVTTADTFEARLRFGRFVGLVSSEENTYFLRAFEALGVTVDRRAADPDTQPTAGFKAIMREAAETRSYAAALSVLVVTEWLYLDWASRAPKPPPDNFVHAEWIALHDSPGFCGFVDFLRAELDRVGPTQADLTRLLPSCRRPQTLLLRSRLRRADLTPLPPDGICQPNRDRSGSQQPGCLRRSTPLLAAGCSELLSILAHNRSGRLKADTDGAALVDKSALGGNSPDNIFRGQNRCHLLRPQRRGAVIPEIDIWRAAQLMLKRYGDQALKESSARATELTLAGDDDGARAGLALACRADWLRPKQTDLVPDEGQFRSRFHHPLR